MPLTAFNFKAGVNKEETDYANKGGWVDSNFIRFRKSLPEKIGGWKKLSATAFYGIARALHSWISLGGDRYFGFGTTYKYYIEQGTGYNDVTPIRKESDDSITFSCCYASFWRFTFRKRVENHHFSGMSPFLLSPLTGLYGQREGDTRTD